VRASRLEARQAIGVRRHARGQNLHGDLPPEACVPRQRYTSPMPPGAEGAGDLVGTDAGTGRREA